MAFVRVHTFEPTDPRLGRHVEHDDRSRNYNLASYAVVRLPSDPIRWERQGPIFDQRIGCCTACAALGLMMTEPFSTGQTFTMEDCLDLYRDETRHDGIRGVWEPTDTGSTGLASMRALKRRGLIQAYAHAFSPLVAVAALARGPIAIGIPWYSSMFEPKRGRIVLDRRSDLAGGHELIVDGWDPRTRRLHMTNSWSEGWGAAGGCELDYTDFDWLLRQQGDAVQPVPLRKEAA